ncbi:MAG: short-chain dehydrogenase [Bdellovibrionales bacterium GWA2_49_15]|nr:MAG: short-chain dehydrogenase [Bdellovibrionales bacterium GWA2_49_15]HAZ12863.1 short-chain dehydrogenase [Bdellovibrionales bacterium]
MTIKIALITGANKGLGLEMTRQLAQKGIRVYMAGRDFNKVEAAAKDLKKLKLDVVPILCDVTQSSQIKEAAAHIERQEGKLDILINNAGIMIDSGAWMENNATTVPLEIMRKTYDTNVFGVIDVTQQFLPLLKKAPAARIVNLGSILGSLTLHAQPGSPIYDAKCMAYNSSKAALNAVTIHFAHALKDTKIKVNTAHPGWVKTDLGTEHAPMNVEDGAKTGVQLALLEEAGPTGGFFHMGDRLPW